MRFTADSYVYVPWLCACAVLALSAARHAGQIERAAGRAWPLVRAAPGLCLAGWALLAHRQVEVWRDTVSLWEHAQARYPDDGELVYRYGDALGRAGRPREELALYLEHEEALARAPKVPASLVRWHAFRGELELADRAYSQAFRSTVRQDDGLYAAYVEYVARHPDRHRTAHDVALGHALGVYAAAPRREALPAAQLDRLVEHARRLGRPDIADELRR